jgi:CRISPR-associated protein Cas1
MNDEFKHPVFEYRCTYRRAIELQARLAGKTFTGGNSYQPLVLR